MQWIIESGALLMLVLVVSYGYGYDFAGLHLGCFCHSIVDIMSHSYSLN